MNFDDALKLLRQNSKIARLEWRDNHFLKKKCKYIRCFSKSISDWGSIPHDSTLMRSQDPFSYPFEKLKA